MKHVETGARAPIVILVTGFGAFPGAPTNPSAAILRRLERHRARLARLGLRLETVLLPVVFDAVAMATREAATASRPDVILHVGLAGRRRAVSVETRALNRAGPLHPDAARRRTGPIIQARGPAVLKATWPAHRLVATIRTRGVAVHASIDAGDYVCNTTLYTTLSARLAPIVGFLHVPRTRIATWPSHPAARRRMSVADLTRAVLAALVLLGGEARLGRTAERSRPSPPPTGDASGRR